MRPIQSWQLFFPTAAVLGSVGLSAWGLQLRGTPLGLLPADHAAFMAWGVLGTGVQGFLLTAYAKQNAAPMPGSIHLLVQWLLQVVSAFVLLFRPAMPTAAQTLLVAAPWVAMLVWLVPVGVRSLRRRWDDTTAAIPITILGGLAGSFLHVIEASQPRGIDVAIQAFIAPIALAVLDRVLPAFSTGVTPGYSGARRRIFLGPLLVASWAGLLIPSWCPWTSLVLLGLLVRQWIGWAPWPAVRTPMIAVLYIGTGWFAVAWTLAAIGAPLTVSTHALAVGGLGSLLLGFSMRVVLGHGGMPIRLGYAGAVVFGLAQVAAMVRVVVGQTGWPPNGLILSATLLGTAFVVWLVRFFPICFGAWRVAR